MIDQFGWCTWDSFYHQVNPQGIKTGLRSLSEGGTPAKFFIIDDGWQNTTNEFKKEGEPDIERSHFGAKLTSIKENEKFRQTDASIDLKHFVSDIKSNYGLEYVYVWHAMMGYWGGLIPEGEETNKYNPKLTYPVQSPGNLANVGDDAMVSMEKFGVGVIDPAKISNVYNDLHGYLAAQCVDGVKVDVQNILETIATGLGGRVNLTRHFQQELEGSIATNFRDNGIISCMWMNTDTIYHSKQSAIARASDDYYPEISATQAVHIATVAFNSIFIGEIAVPDWDMFYSLHDAAEFHAIARAVGGCGVYVSDKPEHHDFNILKSSGWEESYEDLEPEQITGVVGVFNCQGAGTWPYFEQTKQQQQKQAGIEISGQASPADLEYFEEVSGKLWTEDCAIYSFKKGSMSQLNKEETFDVTLKTMECDVFTISAIKVYYENLEYAAIGLVYMYNSGGAVDSVEQSRYSSSDLRIISIKGRGEGSFGAFSSVNPKSTVNSKEEEFIFREENNLLTVTVPFGTSDWEIHISF